uniref:Activin_recp domain-containing protein n=1 Tax=Rhabditophanes sp. KR3021 TaxID=114890 RepID=A0AC35TYW0_9BILA
MKIPALFLLLVSVSICEALKKINCFTGTKYFIGQDLEDTTEVCSAPIWGMEPYCYRFEADSPLKKVTKVGCSQVLCSAIRNHCEHTSMLGVTGTVCCCNRHDYCNSQPKTTLINNLILITLPSVAFVFLEYFNI